MLLATALLAVTSQKAQTLTAAFSAQEAQRVYFSDNYEDSNFPQWNIDTVCTTTWRTLSAEAGYKAIDPASTKRLYCQGNATVASHEVMLMAQPQEIKEGSEVGFYVYMNFRDLYDTELIAVEGTDTLTLIRFSEWQQTQADYANATWYQVTKDLTSITGKMARLGFRFHGLGAANAYFSAEDFRLYQTGSDDITVTQRCGLPVHFRNFSTEGATYNWSFPGGTPATSSEANPIVTYAKKGTYDVTLTVRSGDKEESKTLTDYVKVLPQVPTARVAYVNGYHRSVGGTLLVAPGKPFTLRDNSVGDPDYWRWEVSDAKGNVVATSTEKEITLQIDTTLTGTQSAFYQFSLTAGNESGETTYKSGNQEIKVGSSNSVWNITKEESDMWSVYDHAIAGGKGYYAGCNDVGITAWAEKFDAPLDTAAITQVCVLFSARNKYKPSTRIKMAIHEVAADGTPGAIIEGSDITMTPSGLSTSTKKSITYTTKFKYDDKFPLPIVRPFFVVMSGFSTYNNGEDNDIRMMSLVRDEGGKNSVWALRNGAWQENEVPMSMFVSPWVSYSPATVQAAIAAYDLEPTGIVNVNVAQAIGNDVWYTTNGQRINTPTTKGIYIHNGKKVVVK